MCAKALIKPTKKRVIKKPARLEDTSEEETGSVKKIILQFTSSHK
jgi:hypothetical protein